MEEKLIKKMITSCFLQYNHDLDSVPLSEEEYKALYEEICAAKAKDPGHDLFELIEDAVYSYLTA